MVGSMKKMGPCFCILSSLSFPNLHASFFVQSSMLFYSNNVISPSTFLPIVFVHIILFCFESTNYISLKKTKRKKKWKFTKILMLNRKRKKKRDIVGIYFNQISFVNFSLYIIFFSFFLFIVTNQPFSCPNP